MNISTERFGKTKYNEEVIKYSLKNDKGCYVSILNYGGTITEIVVPDKEGILENVVLGLNTIQAYEEQSPYFGSLVGRMAGRISHAQFKIDDNTYSLAKNNNGHNLHGGIQGFDKVIWDAEGSVNENEATLSLHYISEDGEEGFPGNLDVIVRYTFNNSNTLLISYEAITDKKTLVNLTNHSYFNLSGNYKRDILDHVLTIYANEFGCINNEVVPTGIKRVKDTPFDFTKSKRVGEAIDSDDEQIRYGGGYDHPFLLDTNACYAAILEDNESGRRLEIETDQKSVVFYSGNFIDNEMTLIGGKKGENRLGLCLETQYYPDAVNQECFDTYILKPEGVYTAFTKYSFKTN